MPDTRHLPTLYRELVLDRAALASMGEDDRIPMSLSSEYAVERGGLFSDPFLEVLDHSPQAVDLSRTEGGLPLLLDHDPTRQIGVVEDVTVGPDRVLRGKARFSRAPQAQEVRQDVLDGIRSRTSIGYRIREMAQERRASSTEPALFRATRWQLLENSLVSVPADPTVGVGRSVGEATHPVAVRFLASIDAPQGQENRMSDQDTAAAGGAAQQERAESRVQVTREAPPSGMTVTDVRELVDLAASFKLDPGPYINGDRSAAEARRAILTEVQRRQAAAPVVTPAVENYADGKRSFSISAAIRAAKINDWSKAGYERSVSADLAKRAGQDLPANTFLMPTVERLSDEQIAKRSVHVTSTANLGGNAVFTEYGGFIDLLRNKSVVAGLGATVLPGLQGNVSFVTQTQAGTVYWLAENPGSDVTQSNMTFGTVTLSPKTMMAQQAVSNKLLAQASINVDATIRNDLATIVGLEWDRVALHGSGASNQPTGLYTISGVNAEAFGGTVTYAHCVAMASKIVAANAAVGPISFAATPETSAKAIQTQRFTSTDSPIWTGTIEDGTLIGYHAVATNQLAKNLGAGTNEHGLIAGVWPELMIGEWGAVALTVDPYSLAGQDLVRLVVRQYVDVQPRYATAFTKATGLIP